MGKTNGKSQVDPTELDVEHELPASEDDEQAGQSTSPASSAPVETGELEKLRTERDSLLDRLARLQAEFENARKRAVREQQ